MAQVTRRALRSVFSSASCILLTAIGCGADSTAPSAYDERGTDRLGGEVVATVDGRAITRREVAELARQLGAPAQEALARLEAELLLAAEARRNGIDEADDLRVRQAAVQALLAGIEAEVTPASIPDEVVRRLYAEAGEELNRPEQRRASHVLVGITDDEATAAPERLGAARALALTIRAELAAGTTSLETLRAQGARDGFTLTVEELPPYARTGDLEPTFLDALFAMPAPDIAPEPVRTSYGWHVIVLEEIVPALTHTVESAAPELRATEAQRRRFERLQELLVELESRFGVERDERAIQRAMEL